MKGLLPLGMFLFSTIAFAGLTYEGSSTIGENIMPDATKAFSAKSGKNFDSIGLLGSGKGFKALMEGKTQIAGLSRALTGDEKRQKPYSQIIGYDAIAVFVNVENPVKDLKKEQIKGIFTGNITNWKDVGGPNKPIVVITEILSGSDRATIKEFKEMALDGEAYGKTKEIDKPHDCVLAVEKDPWAITHASLSFKEPKVKAVSAMGVTPTNTTIQSGEYFLARPLVLATKELPAGDIKAFFDFILSPEGQAIVAKRFVPVK